MRKNVISTTMARTVSVTSSMATVAKVLERLTRRDRGLACDYRPVVEAGVLKIRRGLLGRCWTLNNVNEIGTVYPVGFGSDDEPARLQDVEELIEDLQADAQRPTITASPNPARQLCGSERSHC